MSIQNPMQFIGLNDRKKVFIFLLLTVLFIFSIFRFLDTPLQTQASPSGIVSFELAGSPEKSTQILSSWDSNAKLFAAFGLGLDFLFMVVYAATISLACLMASTKHSGWFSRLGAWFGVGVFLAAMFDTIENICLWNLLNGNISPVWSILAFWCATFKFTLIVLGLFYAMVGWLLPRKLA